MLNRGESMKMTSMEIGSKEFKKVIRGYSPDEVDDFLVKVANDYEVLYRESSSLKEKGFTLNEKLEHFSKMEETIHNTLVLAQNAAEQAKQSAQKEAELILRSANDSSKGILDKAHNDVLQINDEFEKLKQDFIKFRAKFRNFMNVQLETFNGLENDLSEKPIEIPTKDKLFDLNRNNECAFKINDGQKEKFNNTLNEIKSFSKKS